MTDQLDGRTLVVTGASRGIGATISQHLLEKGATVIGIARDFQHCAIRQELESRKPNFELLDQVKPVQLDQ